MDQRLTQILFVVMIMLQVVIIFRTGDNNQTIQLSNKQLDSIAHQIETAVIQSKYNVDTDYLITELTEHFNRKLDNPSSQLALHPSTTEPEHTKAHDIDTEERQEQRQQAVRNIEDVLGQAISNGHWTAQDSEAIIKDSAFISLEDRIYLLDLFAQAVEQGLKNVEEYPPPL
ncbi:hypothetical protein [Pleionea sp. CnH1-48]|uniref:hypothetical protein n=1 Tax=Pleionea sp. CnH1-48 TaxID=2954494 RepID=UPI002097C8A1|nr:hypothetical protein [Pleionea sp. CnH1-48]MCO7224918.1 hypothetical protein [Pleionea sp. CnH1-48]